ncbi:MAG: hypothetical protein HZB51_29655 [Chloroflexi bacterium]|nr:hypothetical protein [Chloroflexota bacterium]
MEDTQRTLNRRFETIAWGAFFIWWGITTLFRFLPDGIGTIGIGLILLGLNAVRYANKIPMSTFTIAIGIIAVVLGGLEALRSILRLSFEMPTLPLLLIVIGVIVLVREITRAR